MKKILAVCLGLLLSFGLFACGGEDSVSNTQSETSSEVGGTDSTSTHTHSTNSNYKSNAEEHWKECDCNVKFDVGTHDFSEYVEINVTYDGILEERTCNTCGYIDSRLTPCDHKMEVREQQSTCLEEGYMTSYCSLCGFVENHNVFPLGEHNFTSLVTIKNPTCLEEGEKQGYCETCQKDITIKTPKADHDYEKEVTKYPSCSEEGTITYKCKVCSNSKEESIKKVAHSFGEWEVTTESTCSTHGVMERICQVCSLKEEAEAPFGEHSFGEWEVTKPSTIYEEGLETRKCQYCEEIETHKLDKLQGYTVTVSGGIVNKLGESINQNTIYVGEGEVVEIKASNYEGYTFYQWYSDGNEIIPTSTFKLKVTRNTYFYICFEEELDYGEWILQQEPTCTQDGLYYRIEERTGLKQFMVTFSRGHNMMYSEPIVEKEATCLEAGLEYYQCEYCDYKEYNETGPNGHTWSNEYVVVEDAYGPKVGIKETSCIHCDAKKTKEFIKAAYPDGNIKVTLDWSNRAYVSSADRDEKHWMIDENKYVYYIMRDSSGHSSGNYAHFYFYYEDKGPHSPVFVKKLVGDKYNPREQYAGNGWGVITYVDSYEAFIKYIDDAHKGKDNGLNNTSLYHLYTMWEERFNEAGGIPNGFYCTAVTEYLGYQCRVYENGYFAYYVNEDNCCLWYSGMKDNRDLAYVTNIEQITEMPFEYPNITESYAYQIDIEDGKDESFKDQYYFQIESLYTVVDIYEKNYTNGRYKIVGYEVLSSDGRWVKIEELTKFSTHWKFDRDTDNTYRYIIDHYLEGKIPDTIKIRAITEKADLPVHVKVTNGYIYLSPNEYGSEEDFAANQTLWLCSRFDESNKFIEKWVVTVNGETTEYYDNYNLEITLPESGIVVAECVLKDISTLDKVPVTINIVGNGTVNKESGEYSPAEELQLFASANRGYVFVGWYVQGMFNNGGEDIPMMLSLEEDGDEIVDYYTYGDFFSNKPIYSFSLFDVYDEQVIITAVFERINTEKDYIDVVVENGFLTGYRYTDLCVSALRLSEPNYKDIIPYTEEIQRVTGWTLTETTPEGTNTQVLEGTWNGYYFEYDSSLTPVYGE